VPITFISDEFQALSVSFFLALADSFHLLLVSRIQCKVANDKFVLKPELGDTLYVPPLAELSN